MSIFNLYCHIMKNSLTINQTTEVYASFILDTLENDSFLQTSALDDDKEVKEDFESFTLLIRNSQDPEPSQEPLRNFDLKNFNLKNNTSDIEDVTMPSLPH